MTQKELQKAYAITDDCIKVCDKIHVVKENKVSFRLERKSIKDDTVYCIKVDDCMIKSSEKEKCDFVFFRLKQDKNATNQREFLFVELKNALIHKAYSQIVTTLKTHFKSPPKRECLGFIIANRVPSGADIQNLKKNFIRDFGQDLIIKSNTYTHTPQ
jgi:hypothetical protein